MSKPYHDEETLRRLHWDEGLSMREIGRRFDVSHKTIGYWFDKHDLDRRGVGGRMRKAKFMTAPENSGSAGYELWRTKEDRVDHRVRVHRLLAVAEFGFDAVADNHVHHKNGIKWDNRPENLEVLPNGEHVKQHHEAGDYDGNEFWKESPNFNANGNNR